MKRFEKDPDEQLDYTFDFDALLETNEVIDSTAWTVPAGLTLVTDTIDAAGKRATVWLAGGTAGDTYEVECRITSNATPARIIERAFTVYVRNTT